MEEIAIRRKKNGASLLSCREYLLVGNTKPTCLGKGNADMTARRQQHHCGQGKVLVKEERHANAVS